jgi:hypothetical protein
MQLYNQKGEKGAKKTIEMEKFTFVTQWPDQKS